MKETNSRRADGPVADPRVLVTGAKGAIGRVLQDRLRGPSIAYTDRETFDVGDPAGMAGRLEGIHTVVHLASTLRSSEPAPARAAASLRLARNVVRAALESQVRRVVLLSSVQAAPHPDAWRGREAELGWSPAARRTGHAIERLGRRAAARGLDIVVVRCGGVRWPDYPPGGMEASLWLSHEDCADLFRHCAQTPVCPGRYALFVAVSDTAPRLYDTRNPIGWVSRTQRAGLRRYLRLRKVQVKSFLKVWIARRFG